MVLRKLIISVLSLFLLLFSYSPLAVLQPKPVYAYQVISCTIEFRDDQGNTVLQLDDSKNYSLHIAISGGSSAAPFRIYDTGGNSLSADLGRRPLDVTLQNPFGHNNPDGPYQFSIYTTDQSLSCNDYNSSDYLQIAFTATPATTCAFTFGQSPSDTLKVSVHATNCQGKSWEYKLGDTSHPSSPVENGTVPSNDWRRDFDFPFDKTSAVMIIDGVEKRVDRTPTPGGACGGDITDVQLDAQPAASGQAVTYTATVTIRGSTSNSSSNYYITIDGGSQIPVGGSGTSWSAPAGDFTQDRNSVQHVATLYKTGRQDACDSFQFVITGGYNPLSGENPCPGGNCTTAIGTFSSEPIEFVGQVLTIATGLAGGIAFILMVIGAIRVLTSTGNPQNVNAGRDMIIAALAGLLFIIFSVLILKFIGVNIFGGGINPFNP